jgi:hypothetical protein
MPSKPDLNDFTLTEHGAQLRKAAVLPQVPDLIAALSSLPSEQAGVRISALPALSS